MISKNILNKFLFTSATLLLFIFSGCDTSETTSGSVSLSLTPPITNKVSQGEIVLDTVKILLGDIKIRHQGGTLENNMHLGTMVVYLSTTEMTTDFTVEDVPAGNYDRIRFEVHKCGGSETPPDPEFREGSDASLRYSVIVKGTYNLIPFTYKSTKSAHQDIKLETPIIVEANSTANLTITVDPLSWFYINDVALNPSDTANENDIDNNIAQSFKKCFLDNDHDGIKN